MDPLLRRKIYFAALMKNYREYIDTMKEGMKLTKEIQQLTHNVPNTKEYGIAMLYNAVVRLILQDVDPELLQGPMISTMLLMIERRLDEITNAMENDEPCPGCGKVHGPKRDATADENRRMADELSAMLAQWKPTGKPS